MAEPIARWRVFVGDTNSPRLEEHRGSPQATEDEARRLAVKFCEQRAGLWAVVSRDIAMYVSHVAVVARDVPELAVARVRDPLPEEMPAQHAGREG